MSSPASASVLGWHNLHGFVRTGVNCHKVMVQSYSELGSQIFSTAGSVRIVLPDQLFPGSFLQNQHLPAS